MTDAFRTRAVSDLNGEIECLTGGRFEQFGYGFLSAVLGEDIEERGTSIHGAPRGYTTDGSACGSDHVYEASSDDAYFDGSLSKLHADLRHAVEKHPLCKNIWLLSRKEKSPSSGTIIANIITNFKSAHPAIEKVTVWGSREIAIKIFENLDSDALITCLRPYLPSLVRLADENAFSHQLPSCAGYISRPNEESELVERLRDQPVVVLSGISGAGKSQIACAVAKRLRNENEFETVVWIDASTLRNVRELSSVAIGRYGLTHNIETLTRRRKTLVVLDDITSFTPGSLDGLAVSGSRVLVTTQTATLNAAFQLPDLSMIEARQLLDRDVSPVCPDAVFDVVWQAIGGYPLLLATLNSEAIATGWATVSEYCKDAVTGAEDETHQKVCKRILRRHAHELSTELAFVKWLSTARFDEKLAQVCVSRRAITNLAKRSFLSVTQSGMVRIHNVVYSSISEEISRDSSQEEHFRSKLSAFASDCRPSNREVLARVARRHAELFERLLHEHHDPAFVYALGLARPRHLSVETLGDPSSYAADLMSSVCSETSEIEIRSIIESIEARYTILTGQGDLDRASELLRKDVSVLESLLAIKSLRADWRRDVRHHRAKMLIRLNRADDALSEFQDLVHKFPDFASAQLQISLILKDRKDNLNSAAQALNLVDLARRNPSQISVNVLLEALRIIVGVGSADLFPSIKTDIDLAMKRASDLDISFSYRLVAQVAMKAWYQDPDFVLRLFALIPWADFSPPTDRERFDLAQAYKCAAKSVAALTNNSDRRFDQYLSTADEAYLSICSPNSYHLTHHAEALILRRNFASAEERLGLVPMNDRTCFWYQRQAQALYGLQSFEGAFEAIEQALSRIDDHEKHYRPAFLRDRALIRRGLGDPDSRNDLLTARDLLDPRDRFRAQLEQELMSWEA